ncbi:hypothetical protein GCM10011572_38360 [Pseudoduganella buxea]|uniref:Uncharacterized protein n=1 Tax=Pseudoduganella buxea TaxID=1949069 RepID=A0ABQ1KWF0_9BURK|nr:hypothetical protein GCM10011572_38360 [Pseudoduganella buxea]
MRPLPLTRPGAVPAGRASKYHAQPRSTATAMMAAIAATRRSGERLPGGEPGGGLTASPAAGAAAGGIDTVSFIG